MQGLDWGAYYFFRNEAGNLPGLVTALYLVDVLGDPRLTGTLVAALSLLMALRGNLRAGLIMLAIATLGFACVEGLSWALQAVGKGARPEEPDTAFLPLDSPGFPSRSGCLALVAYGLAAVVLGRIYSAWKIRIPLYAVCLLVILLHGFSQLFLRLHFLSDLFGGWSAGAVILLLCHRFGLGPPIHSS